MIWSFYSVPSISQSPSKPKISANLQYLSKAKLSKIQNYFRNYKINLNRKVFSFYDKNGNGKISKDDICQAIEKATGLYLNDEITSKISEEYGKYV